MPRSKLACYLRDEAWRFGVSRGDLDSWVVKEADMDGQQRRFLQGETYWQRGCPRHGERMSVANNVETDVVTWAPARDG